MNKKRFWYHFIAFFLLIGLLLPTAAPISTYAEEELYLAFQNWGSTSVINLSRADRSLCRVDELCLNPGEKVDLCFINASFWKDAKWTSSNPKAATVNGDGVITAVSSGITEITLTYSKKITGRKVSASVMVYVGEENWGMYLGASSLTCYSDTYEIKVGSRIALDLWEKEMNKNTEQQSSYMQQPWIRTSWKSSNEYIAPVYGGTVVGKKEGTVTISVEILNLVLNTSIFKEITVNVTEPAYEEEETSWDNKYYLMYGENYKKLFETAGLNSTVDIEYDLLDDAWRVWSGEVNKIGISGFSELADIANGLSTAFEGLVNGKGYHVEESHREALLYLIQKMAEDESSDAYYLNKTKEAVEKSQGVAESLDDVHGFADAIKKIDQAGIKIPESERNAIADYVLNDMAGHLDTMLSQGVTVMDYLALTLCLYELDEELLDDLQKCSEPGEALYEDVELIRQEKAKDPTKYFWEKFGEEKFVKIATKVLIKLAGKEAMGVVNGASDLVTMVINMAGVEDLSTYTKTTYLMEYAACASERASELRTEIKKNYDSYSDEELQEKIDEYEKVYQLYLTIARIAIDTIDKEFWEAADEEVHEDYAMNYDLDSHVATAMVWYLNQYPDAEERKEVERISVSSKMDDLLKLLNGKYFTVNQKACATEREDYHGCANCSATNIVKADWFINLFGNINVNNFPEHDVNSKNRDHTGRSCFGFACFAQWYLYADSATEKLTGERVAAVKFNKTNMQKYVKPGDVVRVNGHSVLVYAVEDSGLRVIDCNWNMNKQLNCVVQKHLLSYTHKDFTGYTAYINRVTKVESIGEGMAGLYTVSTTGNSTGSSDNSGGYEDYSDTYGVLDLSSTTWSSYNVGLNKDMYADKAYTVHHNSKLEILGEYTNSKGNKVYHVYSQELQMECYIAAKYVRVDYSNRELYGALDLSSTNWSSYNVGLDKNMNANKAYPISNGSRLKIIAKYVSAKGNDIYEVYSYDLNMECYVSAKFVKLDK